MSIGKQFLESTIDNINNASRRIIHCLDQLEEKHIWYRQGEEINSIGIILNHLRGNLRQWIISGIGGAQDIRHRPLEFIDTSRLSKDELKKKFLEIISDCIEVIKGFDPENLLEARRIQGYDESALSAIYSTVVHLDLHAGQITFITQLIIKSDYKLYWVPQTKEQASE